MIRMVEEVVTPEEAHLATGSSAPPAPSTAPTDSRSTTPACGFEVRKVVCGTKTLMGVEERFPDRSCLSCSR